MLIFKGYIGFERQKKLSNMLSLNKVVFKTLAFEKTKAFSDHTHFSFEQIWYSNLRDRKNMSHNRMSFRDRCC